MRILHILAQHELTGAEVFAHQLAVQQTQAGHDVWVVSDKWHSDTPGCVLTLPISQRSLLQRWHNIRELRQLIRSEEITVVHAHARAATWVGYWATRGLKMPLISSVHGRQSPRLSKRLWDVYGEAVIPVSQDLCTQITSQLKLNHNKCHVIPNGIDTTDLPQPPIRSRSSIRKVTIAGRFTKVKGQRMAELLQYVVPTLLKQHPDLQIELIGGEVQQFPATVQQDWQQLQQRYPERLHCLGFCADFQNTLSQAELVVASGRIAIEALIQGIPTFAIGEAQCNGLVTPTTLPLAIASNFGDMSHQGIKFGKLDYPAIAKALSQAIDHSPPTQDRKSMRAQVKHHFCWDTVLPQILSVYGNAKMRALQPKHIPILMYHRVVAQTPQTRHRIYVTTQVFAQQLAMLKQHGYTSITFQDYHAFRLGERDYADWPKKPVILTFDDGYVDNLEHALPLMEEHGFKGVVYALGNRELKYNQWDVVDSRLSGNNGVENGHNNPHTADEPAVPLMDNSQLKLLQQAGWEIGAHTLNHPHLPQLGLKQAQHEIQQSKAELEKYLDTEIISFAYPYGEYSPAIECLAESAGFEYGVATDTGGMHLEDQRHAIFRARISPNDSGFRFWKKIQSWYRHYYLWKRGQ